MATCAQCTVSFEPKLTGPPPTYCSTGCRRRAAYERERADGRYDRALAARRTRPHVEYQLSCAFCSSPFVGKRRDRMYCSKRCADVGNPNRCGQDGCGRPRRAKGLCSTHYNDERYPGQQRRPPDDPEAKRKRDAIRSKRRRALVRGVRADRVERDVLGDRDGWRCGICGTQINKALPYPHPMSPSVDHVVPLSEGGEHTYANTRIAHLTCNVMRSDRGGNEQLALIG